MLQWLQEKVGFFDQGSEFIILESLLLMWYEYVKKSELDCCCFQLYFLSDSSL